MSPQVRSVVDWRDTVRTALSEGTLHLHLHSTGITLVTVRTFICEDEPDRCLKLRIRSREEAR